jgi:putative spermidine/putrescine transport system substrate-binding protein
MATAAGAQQITVMGWGGAYTQSQVEAYHKPFAAATGVTVNSVDADNPATPIKAQVEANNVTIDVASVEIADAVRLCDEGLVVEIDASTLPAAPDGTPATDDFIAGTLTDCMIPTDVFATAIAYDTTKFPNGGPTTIADFFDTEGFPGKRGLKKGAKTTLEMALMADGVPASEVYALLETEEGVDARLRQARHDQGRRRLVGSGLAAAAASGGRRGVDDDGLERPDLQRGRGRGQALQHPLGRPGLRMGGLGDPEGRTQHGGRARVREVLDLDRAARQRGRVDLLRPAAQVLGPARRQLPGRRHDRDGTAPAHEPREPDERAGFLLEFWADRDAELNERFNAWLAAN